MNVGEHRPGERVYELADDWSNLREGCYAKLPSGDWAVHPPGGAYGTLSPRVHRIEEHEDGTITVSPSILMTHGPLGSQGWHGFLLRGVWSRV